MPPTNPLTGLGGQSRKPPAIDDALALLPLLTGGAPSPIPTAGGFLFGPEERALQHKFYTDAAAYNDRHTQLAVGLAAMAEEGRRRREQAAAARGLASGLNLSPAIGEAAALDPKLAQSVATEAAKRELPPAFGSLHASEKWARGQGLTPGTPEYVQAVQAYPTLRADRTNVNVGFGNAFDKAIAAAIGRAFGKSVEEINKQGAAADTMLSGLDKVESLLKASAADPGAFATAKYEILNGLQSLGLETGKLASIENYQTFESAVTDLVTSQARRLPGQFSDKEMKVMQNLFPRYRNQPGASLLSIRMIREGAWRDQDRDTFVNRVIMDSAASGSPRTAIGAVNQWRKLRGSAPPVRIHPDTGAPVFWHEFVPDAEAAGLTPDEALKTWLEDYRAP